MRDAPTDAMIRPSGGLSAWLSWAAPLTLAAAALYLMSALS